MGPRRCALGRGMKSLGVLGSGLRDGGHSRCWRDQRLRYQLLTWTALTQLRRTDDHYITPHHSARDNGSQRDAYAFPPHDVPCPGP